jgi:hypothetical protein
LHSCTRKRVLARTSCATTAFDVFAAKAELIAGVGTTDHDYGDTGAQDCTVVLDVDELASTAFQADVYTRETETDGWSLMGGFGCEAVDTQGYFSFQRFRYVRVIVTVTGSDLVGGVTGY